MACWCRWSTVWPKLTHALLHANFTNQGVVTYTLPVEELAAGIKIDSDQGIKMNSERLISTDQCTFSDTWQAWVRFVLWTPVASSDQEPRNGAIKRSRTIFIDQDSWSRSQTLLQATDPLLTMPLVLSSRTQFILTSSSPNPQLSHLFLSLLLLYSNEKVMEASSALYSGIITHQFKLWPNPQKHQTLHLYIYIMWPGISKPRAEAQSLQKPKIRFITTRLKL